jgi:hypothetical protein
MRKGFLGWFSINMPLRWSFGWDGTPRGGTAAYNKTRVVVLNVLIAVFF